MGFNSGKEIVLNDFLQKYGIITFQNIFFSQ
jgi:hypothetical protein